jgi:hypothetical protein
MDENIIKLQAATDEAEAQMEVCTEALKLADTQLKEAKEKYRNLPQGEQESLQVNTTGLPDLLETQTRAKNLCETVQTRYDTNKRYLDAMKQKQGN